MVDYPCGEFSDCSFSQFRSIMRTCCLGLGVEGYCIGLGLETYCLGLDLGGYCLGPMIDISKLL